MNISYQHTLTLGEVVAIIIGLIALIPILIGFCVWLRGKKYPISMAYRGERGKYQRTCQCTKGRRLVEIRLIRIPAARHRRMTESDPKPTSPLAVARRAVEGARLAPTGQSIRSLHPAVEA